MRLIQVTAAAIIAPMSAPALAEEYFAVTPSGAAETLFAEPSAEVVGKLSAKCIDAHWSIASSTSTEVVCEAPLNFGQSLMGTLLMGNSYSTPPRRFFKYVVSTIGGVSRVQASGWMELQMAFGQTRRTDFSGAQFHNGAMNFMTAAGGKPPKGTTFPNHVFLGAGLEPVSNGKVTNMRITSLQEGSAVGQAGVQVGDQIASIAGKHFKNGDDLQDALAKAAKTPSYALDIVRDGKPMKLSVARAFRPTYTEEVIAAAATPIAVTVTNPSALSIADELTKLGRLKADGLITQDEFDQQKAKLLSR